MDMNSRDWTTLMKSAENANNSTITKSNSSSSSISTSTNQNNKVISVSSSSSSNSKPKSQARVENKNKAKFNSNSAKSSAKTKPVKNDNLSLPWSCTLGLVNIAKLDSLETIYHLKNRDAALSLIIDSPKTLKQLVNKKGTNAKKLFDSNYNLFLAKHKGKAKKHYNKFYTSQRYKN